MFQMPHLPAWLVIAVMVAASLLVFALWPEAVLQILVVGLLLLLLFAIFWPASLAFGVVARTLLAFRTWLRKYWDEQGG